ncbi:MAG TPA: hypothetical protein VFP87_04165 [Chitinophagaceae bacterium]|nr:hypothetical protein [Chitinophagaceae bacterium]
MLNKKFVIVSVVFLGASVFFVGCYKDRTVVTDVPEITRTVTFSQDIIPIFNASCNTSGCHSSGGQRPDLTAPNAYNSLSTGGYVDKDNPENSLLYLKVSGQKGTPMPPGGVNKEYSALILAWIKQGANNN